MTGTTHLRSVWNQSADPRDRRHDRPGGAARALYLVPVSHHSPTRVAAEHGFPGPFC